MKSVNQITLIGNVGKEPVMRQTSGDVSILNFSLACDRPPPKDAKFANAKTDWFNVAVVGKFGEALEPHIKKGTRLFVAGPMQTSTKTDDDGTQHHYHTVYARELVILDKKEIPSDLSPTDDILF